MVFIPVFFGAQCHPLSGKNVEQNDKSREPFYGLSSGDGRVLLAAGREKYV